MFYSLIKQEFLTNQGARWVHFSFNLLNVVFFKQLHFCFWCLMLILVLNQLSLDTFDLLQCYRCTLGINRKILY